MIATEHPENGQLMAFAQGQLEWNEIDGIQEHLAGCSTCCEVVSSIPDDGLAELLRRVGSRPELLQPQGTADTLTAREDERLSSDLDAVGASLAEVLQDSNRYRVLDRIGRGGMGDVYRAEHRLMHRTVALKAIHREFTSDPQAVKRFEREVRAAAQLDHPNIVRAYDADKVKGVHFLALEYVSGTDLAEVVKESGPLSITLACEYIQQTACGLQHAHEQGMVHRDIKPHNLMLADDGTIKILDFGLASLTERRTDDAPQREPGDGLTLVGSVMGTPDFIAPEQADDARSVDSRADLYSLGATLYYLLTGHGPFPDGDNMDKIRQHRHADALPLDQVRIDVPRELAQLVSDLLSKDPAKRPQSPRAVAEALAPFVDRHLGKDRDAVARPRRLPLGIFAIGLGLILTACLVMGVVVPSIVEAYQGTIQIQAEVDGVKIEIHQQGGGVSRVSTVDGHRNVRVKRGVYNVKLARGYQEYQLSRDMFRLGQGTVVEIKVTKRANPIETTGGAADSPWSTIDIHANDATGEKIPVPPLGGAVKIQYLSGEWKAWGQIPDVSPDDTEGRGEGRCRIGLFGKRRGGQHELIQLVPEGTARSPYVFCPDEAYVELSLGINDNDGAWAENPGTVTYQVMPLEPLAVPEEVNEETATKAIVDWGGKLKRASDGRVVNIELRDPRIDDRHIRCLEPFVAVESLYLSRTSITDEGVASIVDHHPKLRNLYLSETKVGSEALIHLRRLPSLNVLYLDHNAITDKDLQQVAEYPSLVSLSVANTDVTHVGVAALKGLKALQYLSVARTEVDDKAVPTMMSMELLSMINLRGSKVSRDGYNRLRKAGPNRKIDF